MSTLSTLPTTVDLTIYRGDSVNIDFVISNYTIPATPTWNSSIKSGNTFTKAATVTNSSQTVNFVLAGTDTADLVPGTIYTYDIQMVKNTTTKTLIKGTITVVGDITLTGDGA